MMVKIPWVNDPENPQEAWPLMEMGF